MAIELAVGIDIGGTHTVIGLVDEIGTIVGSSSFSTTDFPDINVYVNEISKHIVTIHSSLNDESTIKGIGIGAPNGNYYRGTIEHAPNLVWKGIVPFVEMIKIRTGIKDVVLTNDAKAAAIGEMIFGGAKGMKDFIVITIGTGLGSGIVSNGNIVYGYDGFAGEMGHVIVKRDGRMCTCGRKGCLEAYVSKRGIIQTYMELKEINCKLESAEITPAYISELACKGDEIALNVFEETGRILGQTLADSACYLEPEAIFIFGGIAQSGDLLLTPIRIYMEQNLHNIYQGKIKIIPSALPGNTAAILGAAALIWKQ
ncbi:MAG: ROK family protein [Bacteroidota bacterium]